MNKYLESLNKSILFRNLSKDEINHLISTVPYNISNYKKDDVIAIEEDDCSSLGIILYGTIEIHKPFPSGKIVTINNFEAGNVFGEALIFSGRHKYPATIISSSDSEIMYIKKEDIIRLMSSDDRVLNNFVSVLSNRILMLNDRITNLSYDTVRKKIANIILVEYSKQKTKMITLPVCRKKMAELLNIPRPSLSRELIKMKEDGIIDYHKNKLKIIDIDLLEECLLK
ncbi:Crp/Fnr family transcriptional regulator [Tissierella praeacuta]|uniref:cAMP-binding domain of CRP or a regulatory subunit of cAMP-dependent protein kinases n=1 Tax=Tissierella praeacuta DSM 18095 TaxID=1123404 RepID=A0A1M4YCY0_9FIRM|nr:Crp/Fnr family transcriptional regulator [Tissierella praeacuta]MBU5256276.1 Crp/Fnr family transcriptional regulator [Tissierella praeacuta]SHF03549.1 cAMP-binding domain of CRP or a regulatory subunit of cAMP-dependent protein kinases [Tissierella praeacuta DSM 18095]SUP03180.1 transcriptional regulator FixK [Tissierella praeacuta]